FCAGAGTFAGKAPAFAGKAPMEDVLASTLAAAADVTLFAAFVAAVFAVVVAEVLAASTAPLAMALTSALAGICAYAVPMAKVAIATAEISFFMMYLSFEIYMQAFPTCSNNVSSENVLTQQCEQLKNMRFDQRSFIALQ
ncbi:hypothetical protein, partial [Collimonas humicola]|uniref:hypothetical protein n=1 Tax=Collimonas humicola TaxID=2825886 RepID=UPI001B8B9B75